MNQNETKLNNLPDGWKWVKLGEVAEITSSKRIFQDDYVSDGIPFYRTKEIKELSEGKEISIELFITKEKYDSIKSQYEIPKINDILISAVGTIGVSYIIKDDKPFYFKDGNLIWIRKINHANSKFINYLLEHFIRFKQNISTSGSAYNALTIIKLKDFEIPLPPLSIQAQIVEKLETLLSELDKGKAQLLTAQAQLKTYRQAVLKYAFEGKLTGGTEGWGWVKLGDVSIIKRGKSKHRPRNEPKLFGGKYPFIQTGDIRNANGGVVKTYSQTYSELGLSQSKLWKKGTLCITIAANIGETAILGFDACFPDSVVGIVSNEDKMCSSFINYFLISFKQKLGELAPATAQKNVNVDILENIDILLPHLSNQQKIVQEIESRLSVCDKLEETIKASLLQCETLRQSVLKRAFEGKLV